MKYQKYLNSLPSILGFLVIGWLAVVYPQGILGIGILTGFLTYLLIAICFSPLGSLTLGKTLKPLPWKTWLWKIISGQLALGIFTLGAFVAFFSLGPPYAQEKMTFVLMKETLRHYSPWQWGIFPWGIYALYAILIAYIVYIKKGLAYPYQIAREFCPKRFEAMIKTFSEGTVNATTLMAYSLTAAAIVLLLSYSLEAFLGVHHFYVPFITISLLSFIMPWYSLKRTRQRFNKMTRRKATLNQLFFIFIPPLVVIFVLAAIANGWFLSRYGHLYAQLQCQQCAHYLNQAPMITRFGVMYWGWWLIWTPLAGSYIAAISQGRTLRELILGIYLVPLLLGLLIAGGKATWFTALFLKVSVLPFPLFLLILAVAMWAIFYKMNKDQRTSEVFFSGLMPMKDMIRSRLRIRDGSKIMTMNKLAPRLFISIIATLFMHTLAGWYGIQLQVAVMGTLVIWFIYGVAEFLAIQFFKDKSWKSNQTILPFNEDPHPHPRRSDKRFSLVKH